MNRKQKIDFLKKFHQFGIINKVAEDKEVRIWLCKDDRYTLQGTDRTLSELEMAGYMANEGRLFANILVYLVGPPLASSEDEIDMNPYTGPYYSPKGYA